MRWNYLFGTCTNVYLHVLVTNHVYYSQSLSLFKIINPATSFYYNWCMMQHVNFYLDIDACVPVSMKGSVAQKFFCIWYYDGTSVL